MKLQTIVLAKEFFISFLTGAVIMGGIIMFVMAVLFIIDLIMDRVKRR